MTHRLYLVDVFAERRPYAGNHPIFGTAWVLREHLSASSQDPLHLDLSVCQLFRVLFPCA